MDYAYIIFSWCRKTMKLWITFWGCGTRTIWHATDSDQKLAPARLYESFKHVVGCQKTAFWGNRRIVESPGIIHATRVLFLNLAFSRVDCQKNVSELKTEDSTRAFQNKEWGDRKYSTVHNRSESARSMRNTRITLSYCRTMTPSASKPLSYRGFTVH